MFLLTAVCQILISGSVLLASQPGLNVPVLPTVELREMDRRPTLHLGQKVQFYVQLDRELETWNPYATRFGAENYRAFRVWGDDQRLWSASDYRKPLGHIFVSRQTPDAWRLERTDKFQRFLVVGTVRNVLVGEPWIEVQRVFRSRKTVPEGTLLHAIRGIELLDKGACLMAKGEFTRALAPSLPTPVRRELEQLIAECDESADGSTAQLR